MVKRTFSVTLEEDFVNEAKKILNSRGQRLSPILNVYLGDWIEEQKEIEELLREHRKKNLEREDK